MSFLNQLSHKLLKHQRSGDHFIFNFNNWPIEKQYVKQIYNNTPSIMAASIIQRSMFASHVGIEIAKRLYLDYVYLIIVYATCTTFCTNISEKSYW